MINFKLRYLNVLLQIRVVIVSTSISMQTKNSVLKFGVNVHQMAQLVIALYQIIRHFRNIQFLRCSFKEMGQIVIL